ncbi:MAG: class I SAM-dependent methyltransferase [Pseudomonadota bacterium]
MQLPIDPGTVKGFLAAEEGACLYRHALKQASKGPLAEIGSYCGLSTLYLGTACRDGDGLLFAIDHHCGSEENQPGWEYHDPELWDATAGRLDTLPVFRDTLQRAGLEDQVIPVVGRSARIATAWQTPLAFLFIDGGHTTEHAMHDYSGWTRHLISGGVLAIHDVFPDPADGGRPPFEIYQLALASGLFEDVEAVASLRVLRRR